MEQFRKEEKLVIHNKHHFHALSGIHKSVKPIAGEKMIQKEHPSSFLGTGPRSLSELEKGIEGVTQKMLLEQLDWYRIHGGKWYAGGAYGERAWERDRIRWINFMDIEDFHSSGPYM